MKKINYKFLKDKNIADFLILTATRRETDALLNVLSPISEDVLQVEVENRTYHIGRLGKYQIIHTQCTTMGVAGEGSSIITCNNAFSDWSCIKGVIMIGIAFGMYDDQKYGNVLVADKIYPYENQRVGAEVVYRGEPCVPDSTLIKQCYKVQRIWKGKNFQDEECFVEICPLVSGEKLVDNLALRDELKSHFKDARGGEMEGQGVSTACTNANKPWLLIKAICDFADGNKGEQKHEKQDSAASLAFDFCVKLLDTKALLGETQYANFSDTEIDSKKVLFQIYDFDKEAFYIKREIDQFLEQCLKTHGCWIIGESGVGKSVALTRTLKQSNSLFIMIDLSTCIDCTVDEMFVSIYESLSDSACDENIRNRKRCVEAILAYLDTKYTGKEVFLFIEEIPIDGESTVYGDFVKSLYAMIISAERKLKNIKLRLVLSSINTPKKYIMPAQNKIESYLKFKEMRRWSDDECKSLVELLCEALNISLEENYPSELLIKRLENSPRKIKNCFNQAVACKISKLNSSIIERLMDY